MCSPFPVSKQNSDFVELIASNSESDLVYFEKDFTYHKIYGYITKYGKLCVFQFTHECTGVSWEAWGFDYPIGFNPKNNFSTFDSNGNIVKVSKGYIFGGANNGNGTGTGILLYLVD